MFLHLFGGFPGKMVKQGLMAKEAVKKFSPSPSIETRHDNVKNAEFGLSFSREFDVVLRALDDLDAQR